MLAKAFSIALAYIACKRGSTVFPASFACLEAFFGSLVTYGFSSGGIESSDPG